MSFGIGRRQGLDPESLWLWCRLADAVLIRPVAWESPYATNVALKSKQTNKQTKQNKKIPYASDVVLRKKDVGSRYTGQITSHIYTGL